MLEVSRQARGCYEIWIVKVGRRTHAVIFDFHRFSIALHGGFAVTLADIRIGFSLPRSRVVKWFPSRFEVSFDKPYCDSGLAVDKLDCLND